MKVGFCALGCKVNQYELDAYANLFRNAGFTIGSFDEVCDVYVVNTCAVTNIAERKDRQILRRAKKNNPSALVVATGCYVQTSPDAVAGLSEVDLLIGTAQRYRIVELVEAKLRGETLDLLTDIRTQRMYEELEVEGTRERTRAYIKIQDGCDSFCSYCIVPYARGPVRSRQIDSIVREAQTLAERGCCEVVLTGIQVAHYGKDLPQDVTLRDVIRAVSAVPGIARIRLSSIDPRAFTDAFIREMADNPKICRHFHISLQSGSATVLKRMNRKYTPQFYLEMLTKIRAAMPDASITTDVICGFPEESEEEFAQTIRFCKEARFAKIHVFPYSERAATAAAAMVQLPKPLRDARAAKLTQVAKAIQAEYEASYVGSHALVLIEQCKDGVAEGLTGNYLRVFLPAGDAEVGEIVPVRITDYDDGVLHGVRE